MTTKAKNRILAYLVLAMMLFIVIIGNSKSLVDAPQDTVTVLLPKDVPVIVAVEEPTIDAKQFECLRANLYHEAGNQDRRGMEAVALVTLNRTKTNHYPGTVCEVVKAWAYNKRGKKVCQFSWYCDGKSDEPKLTSVVKGKVVPNKAEIEAWETAAAIAKAALRGDIPDFLGRATHYHANYVNPDWANAPKRYKRLTSVGVHIFYHDAYLTLKA